MKKRLVIALVCVTLMLMFLPQTVRAADYNYVDENGDTQTVIDAIPVTADTATMTSGWYVVDSNVTRNGTINVSGDVHLILMDGFALSVTGSYDAGINVSSGNNLTIYGQGAGTGAIIAQGHTYGAGIGSGYYETTGSITINGGTITATGDGGAGIGGGSYSDVSNITINGGDVTANGGEYGAGIGSCGGKACGTILIAGGTVHANGGWGAAGIGCGYNGDGGSITINDGEVHAVGGLGGMGIGTNFGTVSINISGGTIKAYGGDYSPGIGGGDKTNAYGQVSVGSVHITGGNITATGSNYAAGIGGNYSGFICNITIDGGTINATGKSHGAGIGGGADCKLMGSIIINGGSITANGGFCGAGIGAGGGKDNKYSRCGDITITGGEVTAQGGLYSAGIGGGGGEYASTCGTVTITGADTVVNAKGDNSTNAYDIGSGHKFSYMTTINGGTLKADGGATVNLNQKGSNSSKQYVTCIIGGSGAGAEAGIYYYGQKVNGVIDMSAPGTGKLCGTGYTYSESTVSIGTAGAYAVINSTTTNQLKVTDGITANVTLGDASIDVSEISGACAFDMTGATVNLTLVGDNTLKSGSGRAGIQAPAGSTLTILSASAGTLTTQGGADGAGIGGGNEISGGTITINSGTVTATGGSRGAGIGGGNYHTTGGTITINGGTVTARGGNGAAGIGGGDRGSGGSITINGGTVEARGGTVSYSSGAGIGGGVYGNGGSITIGGGTVNAWGGGDGAGIGGGQSGSGGNITISGGNVTANGGSYGAGIGGGYESDAGIIIISGGTVIAQGGDQGAGIGCGGRGGSSGSVAISGGTITAYGGSRGYSGGGGAGIGGGGASGSGNGGASSSVTINGSATVTARGSDGGAGIGGGGAGIGVGGAGGTVLADGENITVSATGGGNGYDIGSGSGNSSGGSLTVKNNATVHLNCNGTNANTSFITCTVGGDGAGLLAGTYLNSQKLLTFSGLTASPTSGAKAFDDVTLTANVTGLSTVNPQGQIAFFAGGSKIGQASLTRAFAGSADATATLIWSSRGGSHMITAQYVPDDSDSYYITDSGELDDYEVAKIEQALLIVSGIPGTATYGDASFTLSASGGSGTGSLSYLVTGDAVSVSTSGTVTMDKAGQATITVTKAGDDNYLPASAVVTITVNKAIPPAVVFPTAGTITYEQELSDSTLTGGSGDGTFAWENPDTVPPVINTGYNVIFTPNDTDNYDYTGVELTKNVSITVNKAVPVVTFPTTDEIIYEQPLSASELTGGSGDGNFAWENPATIPTVVNSGYPVIFTPDDTDNYLTVSRIVPITVQKAQQATINVGGIPSTVTYGDSPFDLSGSGGSGTGDFNYAVASDDVVSVSASGTVTVHKAGTAQITATKKGDDNYLPASADMMITVNKATPPTVVFPSAEELTYGQPLSDSALTGGSAEGTFVWDEPDTIPTVINSGYNVTFTPNDTDNYDYTDVELTKKVSIHVNKATPVVTFPTAGEITYEQPLSDSELTGGSGDGSFAWESPATIPTVVNSGYRVIFTPDDTDNYLTVSEIVPITVQKAQQATLNVGMPSAVTYGDSPFVLSGSGGSGTGTFSYSVKSGDAVSVSTSGTVTVHKAGTAQITANKAGDSNYLPVSTDITITVKKAVPIAVFPTASSLTYGQPLSDSVLTGGSGAGSFAWESTDTIPIVFNSGYSVVFTPSDTNNYLAIKQPVAIAVRKAAQAPLSVSGIPETITFGDKSFELRVIGGSGTGSLSYAVISGNAVTVDALGKVTITHGGTAVIKVTNPGDDNYLPVSHTVSLTVNKVEQTSDLFFTLPESIAYGDASFQIVGSGGNGSGAFSYKVASGDAVAVSPTGDVTVLRPGEAVITAVKAGDSDYFSQEKTIQISVGKGTQSALVITGIPSRITSGSAPFGLVVNGGSGSGIVSYAVTSGRAVSVNTSGIVTVLRPGTAVLTVTKAEDDYYHAATATVEINVRKATSAEDISATSAASATPSSAPSPTVAPSPTAAATPRPTVTDASPSPTESPVSLKPASIQADESTDKIIVTINMDDLPEGTASIKLASGEIISIDSSQSTLELPISQDDLNEDGELVIIALDEENTPLGNYQLDLSEDVWQAGSTNHGTGTVSVLVWIAAGVLVMGAASVVIVTRFKKVK